MPVLGEMNLERGVGWSAAPSSFSEIILVMVAACFVSR